MNDLDSDINSERAESPDASHESDCIVIPSPEANCQNEWYNNTCKDDNMSYSPGILSTEEEVIPSGSNNTNQQISKRKYLTKKKEIAVQSTKHNNKINTFYSSNENFILPEQRDRIISDEVTRQSSDTSTKEIIDNVKHGICIIGMPNGKPCSKAIRTAIHDYIVTELIIAQNLPLSLVESEMFKQFAKIMDSRWTVPNKEKVKDLIDDGFKRICTALHNDLQQADTVSLTADMWTAYSHDKADTIANGKCLKEIMITESKWAKVASIINILKLFDDITNYISSSSYPTMKTIFDNEDLTDTDEELEELKSLANTINLTNTIKKTMAGLFEKYYKLSNDNLLFIVTSIDPRYKNIKLEETILDIQNYLRLGYDEETIDDTFEPLSNKVMLDISQSFLSSIFTAQPNIGRRNEKTRLAPQTFSKIVFCHANQQRYNTMFPDINM
ncbi:29431_t:CDS:2 [Gigaspora margarita]|uniref:29431_t:CDS:1 n=1 Tax=Gigaspora margarita TaxID=4874 RepID=A0ABN7V129_GIGMA|nr:29431_t:CDS:2 [Gigaspora margarita]